MVLGLIQFFFKQGQPANGGQPWTGPISDPKRPGQHCLAYHVNTNSINDLFCNSQRPTICQSGKGKFRHFIFRTRIFISAVHFNFSLTWFLHKKCANCILGFHLKFATNEDIFMWVKSVLKIRFRITNCSFLPILRKCTTRVSIIPDQSFCNGNKWSGKKGFGNFGKFLNSSRMKFPEHRKFLEHGSGYPKCFRRCHRNWKCSIQITNWKLEMFHPDY